jgi:serine/threonine protein phosphatase PrpC
MPAAVSFRSAAASDMGRKRTNNEDRYVCDAERGIYAVVDGMGGEAAGERAAEIAVNLLRARLERRTGTAAERMREAIAVANNEIHEAARANPTWQGMACVLTAVTVEGRRAVVGHVGDSRLYFMRPGQIRKITHDHSPIGEREDRGEITEREAMRHPRRNEVFRDVGSAPHRPDDADFIETAELVLEPDCALLVCSDGLSDLVTSTEIRKIVESHAGDPEAAVAALIEAANAAGGKDNVTAVLVEGPAYAADATSVEARAPALLAGRWFFLLYGALLVLLAIWAGPPLVERLAGPPRRPVSVPRTWTVGPTEAADGATISGVLEKAQPGDTVVVEPGEYRELVRLRGGVILLSREPHAAVLRSTDRGIAILADGARTGRVSGFRIAGDSQHPMSIGVQLKDSGVTLDYLEISGASTAGVEILGEGAPVLRLNQIIRNPGAGVLVRDRARPQLVHNLIAGARPGLEIRNEARPELRGNTFLDDGPEAIWAPRAAAPDAAMLEDNFFGAPERKGTPHRRVRVIP